MKLLTGICLLLLLSGCGYHFPGQAQTFPGEVRTVYLSLLVNRTAEPQLENQLGNMVSEVLARNGKISLVEDQKGAEAILEGVISGYETRALSYDRNDNISEYRSTMVFVAKLRRVKDGRVLWQGRISQDGEYSGVLDKALQEDLEQQAIEKISRRMADELSYRLLEDF